MNSPFLVLRFPSDFRHRKELDKYRNNCEIRIDNKPVHDKTYYEAGIICTRDLLFNLNVTDS